VALSVVFNGSNPDKPNVQEDILIDVEPNEASEAEEKETTNTSQRSFLNKRRNTWNNLIPSDPVTFNDPVLRSFYATLVNFNTNLFKTMCWCHQEGSTLNVI
jgi:hypothetical protein